MSDGPDRSDPMPDEPLPTPRSHPGLERRIVATTLRTGVIVACVLMAAGVALAIGKGRLVAHGVTPGQIWRLVTGGHPSGLMALGLVVLTATPVLRVVLLAAGWAYARDWRFLAVALGVLCAIGVGIALGSI